MFLLLEKLYYSARLQQMLSAISGHGEERTSLFLSRQQVEGIVRYGFRRSYPRRLLIFLLTGGNTHHCSLKKVASVKYGRVRSSSLFISSAERGLNSSAMRTFSSSSFSVDMPTMIVLTGRVRT